MKLYELAAADGRLFSPPCWRSRLALEWHNLSFESIPTTYVGIKQVADGQFTTLPILQDGEVIMADSWEINKYLDTKQQDKIIRNPTEEAQALLTQQLVWPAITLRTIVLDLLAAVAEEDKDYFRSSREKRFNMSLEDMQLPREEGIEKIVHGYQPLENYFSQYECLGGDRINYADITILSHLQLPIQIGKLDLCSKLPATHKWARSCAKKLPSINSWVDS